jgi:uncharacterized protein
MQLSSVFTQFIADCKTMFRGKDSAGSARDFLSPVAILLYVALAVTLVEYVFLPFRLRELMPQFTRAVAPLWFYGPNSTLGDGARGPDWGVLFPYLWWIAGTCFLWVAIPLIVLRSSGEPGSSVGLSMAPLKTSRNIYGLMYLAILPVLIWVSGEQSFTNIYPILRPKNAANWTWWVLLSFWCLYAMQFFAVEFFFRGFIAFRLEKAFGSSAIAMSTVPYCMIHFHKPFPEAIGSIIGGFVLCWLALKTRSIWGGVFLHVAVALTLDVLALWRTNGFPVH